ncbi:MAG TPA: hypothetical protein VFG05_00925 [Methylocella sp.]|nr:hypothetical protein [Methylocella sp.]
MSSRIFPRLAFIALIYPLYDSAHADNFEAQQKALDLITAAADKICNVVSTRGEVNSSEVQGNVTVQLRGLATKLAEAGVSGTGSITSEQYENVLRSDLAATLKDNTACRLKVFETLQQKLLGSSPSIEPGISGTWRDANDPANVTRITQNGDHFEFRRTGIVNGVRFESSGAGRKINGSYTSEYRTAYQNGLTSSGYCSGMTPREGVLVTDCTDTVLGRFSLSSIRE